MRLGKQVRTGFRDPRERPALMQFQATTLDAEL
jgi:hypothetical protein